MKRKEFVIFLMLMGFVLQPALADDRITGTLVLLKTCPGYTSGNESLFTAALTPLLTGIVSQGLQAVGNKLTEAAEEQNVDVIHRGDHLYEWSETKKGFGLEFGCLIVASKGTKKSTRDLASLVAGYPINGPTGGSELVDKLKEAGFSDSLLPGIVGVFELELSAQKDAARLRPIFIVMDHSIREKRVDKKERTMTFQIGLTSPNLGKAFGDLLIKIEKLVIATPYKQDEKRPITSSWFALPSPDAKTAAKVKSFLEKQKTNRSKAEAAKVAGTLAKDFGDTQVAPYLGETPPCPSSDIADERRLEKLAALKMEQAKPKDNQDSVLIEQLANAELFYRTCSEYHAIDADATKLKKGFEDGAGAYDVTVTIKEFRKRPFAKFFGGVLSDSATRSGLTSAVVGAIDPGTIEAQEEEEEAAALAARQAYEDAVVAAEIAKATYEALAAAGEPAQFAAEVDMRAKQRNANRRAEAAGLPIPYPEAGLWF